MLLALFFSRRRKRFKAEIKVRYHYDNDVQINRTEQLSNVIGERSSNVDAAEPVHDQNVNALDLAASGNFECSDEGDDSEETSTTHHYRRLIRAEDAWSKLREGVLATTFENQGSLFGERCHFCDLLGKWYLSMPRL